MTDNNFNKYDDKKPYNNLPIPEGQHLAPFLVENWNEVKAMNYHCENVETWFFRDIPVLVAFTPVTAEQFSTTVKLFWSKVCARIAGHSGNPNVVSYDKLLDDMNSTDGSGCGPAQWSSLENTALLGMIIDDLIKEVGQINPRYGHILNLIKQEYTRSEIVDVLSETYGIKKTQAYSEIRAAQKMAKDLYYAD